MRYQIWRYYWHCRGWHYYYFEALLSQKITSLSHPHFKLHWITFHQCWSWKRRIGCWIKCNFRIAVVLLDEIGVLSRLNPLKYRLHLSFSNFNLKIKLESVNDTSVKMARAFKRDQWNKYMSVIHNLLWSFPQLSMNRILHHVLWSWISFGSVSL